MKKTETVANYLVALVCAAVISSGNNAQADLSVNNGDFQNNAPASNVADVDGWFDANDGGAQGDANWWTSAWYGPTVSPNGTSVMGLSWNGGVPHWAYQGIGNNDGSLSALIIQYDVGSFTDSFEVRDLGVTFSVYQVDGTYVGGADGTDIDGATGAILIDSVSNMHEDFPVGGGMLTGQLAMLDISGTTGGDLYLRVINYAGVDGQPWTAVDNIQIVVPEPSTFALGAMGLALVAVAWRRRRRV